MHTNFFCTNFLNTPQGPGHLGKIPGTSLIPLFETQGRQTFEGGHELFGHHPFAWKTPTPLDGLRTQTVNLCALFSCLINGSRSKEELSEPAKKVLNWNRSSRSTPKPKPDPKRRHRAWKIVPQKPPETCLTDVLGCEGWSKKARKSREILPPQLKTWV